MPIPAQLTLSGNVYPSKTTFPKIGDVSIHPGSGRTPFIDAAIFDGRSWRALDLNGFGFSQSGRVFNHSTEIGPLMRQIEQKICNCKGSPVYYDKPAKSTKRKYIYRGISFSSLAQGTSWSFY